jgi:hypothetical protein
MGQALDWILDENPFYLPSYNSVLDVQQRDISAVFYFATLGQHWSFRRRKLQNHDDIHTDNKTGNEESNSPANFFTNSDVCLWNTHDGNFGITCNDNGTIIELHLQDFGLGGTLPSEIGYLSNLIKFDVAENDIEGSLPEQHGRLANLERMYLEHNQITGTIPTEFANLDSLFDLELGGNSLSGSLPKEMASLKSIKRIDISESSLTGSIPAEFFNLNEQLF